MFCHRCNSSNLETSFRCIQCGANLIGDSVSTPNEFRKLVAPIDARIRKRFFGWAGSFIACMLFVMLANTLFEYEYWVKSNFKVLLIASGIIGNIVGRVFASRL